MTENSTCARCKTRIEGKRFSLRIESEEPGPKPMELSVCEECLRSLERWLSRKGRRSEVPDSTEGLERATRRKRGRDPSPYESELDRKSRLIRLRTVAMIAGTVLGVCGLLGGFITFIFTRKNGP